MGDKRVFGGEDLVHGFSPVWDETIISDWREEKAYNPEVFRQSLQQTADGL
jgi:hypothetical protein